MLGSQNHSLSQLFKQNMCVFKAIYSGPVRTLTDVWAEARAGWIAEFHSICNIVHDVSNLSCPPRAGLNPTAGLPGYEAHAAAEAAVKEASREGTCPHLYVFRIFSV